MTQKWFDESHEAFNAALESFEPGSQWLKVVGSRRFVMEVAPDGDLDEWVEGHAHDRWSGRWAPKSFYNTPYYEALMHLYVDGYQTRLRLQKDGSYLGYEVSPEAYARADRKLRDTHPDIEFGDVPTVTLARL